MRCICGAQRSVAFPGTSSVVLVWWHFPCLYPTFVILSVPCLSWPTLRQSGLLYTKLGYRQGKCHQTRTTDQVPGTWSVVLVWWHIPCLYPTFVILSVPCLSWPTLRQSGLLYTKLGYRQGKCHQTRTTDQVPGTWSVVLVWWHIPCLYPTFVILSVPCDHKIFSSYPRGPDLEWLKYVETHRNPMKCLVKWVWRTQRAFGKLLGGFWTASVEEPNFDD